MYDFRALVEYARTNPKLIKTVGHQNFPNILKLNYTKGCQYGRQWNEWTTLARGVVVDSSTGKPLAFPFRKFFNLGERDETRPENLPRDQKYWITEKYDGVLIVPFRTDSQTLISSRGHFRNQFVDLAAKIAKEKYGGFENLDLENHTYMFELIAPTFNRENFLVTKYETEDLILIGVRDMRDFNLLAPPKVAELARSKGLTPYDVHDLRFEDLVNFKDRVDGSLREGWVTQYESGLMLKVKRLEYLKYLSAMLGISHKNTCDSMLNGTLETLLRELPEELGSQVSVLATEINAEKERRKVDVLCAWQEIQGKNLQTRKDFSLYVIKEFPELKSYLFTLYDGRSETLDKMLVRQIRDDKKESQKPDKEDF